MDTDTAPRFPVLEAADGYAIPAVDQHVRTLLDDIRRARRSGLPLDSVDPRPFRLVHSSQVYDPAAVDDWFDACCSELEARRQHPSHKPRPTAYEGDLDDPAELRGVSTSPSTSSDEFVSTIPVWARVVAIAVIVALLGTYVISFF